MRTTKKLTGRVPEDAIKRIELPVISKVIIDRYLKLDDLTASVSDAMDGLGLFAAIPAATLQPNTAGKRIVGRAVTVRNCERTESTTRAAAENTNGMGEREAYNLSEPGDVVVIEGISGVSNMGGQSATLAQRSGCAGAVIDGSHRDPSVSIQANFPIWSRGSTPVTGKWRLQTVEINGRVRVCGVAVDAGDLVVADGAGIVFVPYAHIETVLMNAERINAKDSHQKQDIASEIDLSTLAASRHK